MKRMVVVADMHSGHEYGLCGPDWWRSQNGRTAKTGRFERALWSFYTKAIDALRPIHILGVNGDAIEGKGESSGGVELITPDRHDQVQMAADAINYADAPCVRLIYGTRRHVGKEEDFESVLADKLKAKDVRIQGHAFFRVNGCAIDMKHKVASSAIPHGRFTALARARLWNVMWNAEYEKQPRAGILIRSHTHYFGYAGGPSWLGVTSPALTFNSSYGIRDCEGLVDIGLLVFDFEGDGRYNWWPVLADFSETRVTPEVL
jgi:hypothetical protein